MKAYTHDITNCLSVLKKGGVILYPTDTIWGLGCLVTDEAAIRKIHTIKNRPLEKKLIVLVSDEDMLQRYVGSLSRHVLEKLEESTVPTTIIYPQAKDLSPLLISETGSVAIRIAQDDFCSDLIRSCGVGLTSTSANLSGHPAAVNFNDIEEAVISEADYIVEHRREELDSNSPSKILLLKNNEWVEIRS